MKKYSSQLVQVNFTLQLKKHILKALDEDIPKR